MKQWMRKIVILFIALILPMVGFGIVGYSASEDSNAVAEDSGETSKGPDFVAEGQEQCFEVLDGGRIDIAKPVSGTVEVSGWNNNVDEPVIVTYTDKTAENLSNTIYVYIIKAKNGVYRMGEKVDFQIDGYTSNWKGNANSYRYIGLKINGKTDTIKFTMTDANGYEKQGEIRFVLKGAKYAVRTKEPEAGGKISADKTEAEEGEEVILTAEPESGWKLKGWKVTTESAKEVTVSPDGNTAKFTMPGEAVTVAAEFEKLSDKAELTGVQLLDSEGAVIANGISAEEKTFLMQLSKDIESDIVKSLYLKLFYAKGATVKMLPSGYDDATGSSGTWDSGKIMCNMDVNQPTKFQVTAEDGTKEIYTITIKSYQDIKPDKFYKIAVSTPQGGSLTVTKTEAAQNEKVKVIIVPDAGYELESGSLCYTEAIGSGKTVSIDENSMEFTMPAVEITVTCNWKKTSDQTLKPEVKEPSINTFLVGGVNCSVNNEERLITVMMPYGTNLKSLKLEYIVNNVQSVNLENGQTVDFSSPVQLKLKGTDGNMFVYTVWVTVQEATPAEKLWENLSDPTAHTPWWKRAEGQKNRGNYPNSWGE